MRKVLEARESKMNPGEANSLGQLKQRVGVRE